MGGPYKQVRCNEWPSQGSTDQNRSINFEKSKTDSDQTILRNFGSTRARTQYILENSDQLGQGLNICFINIPKIVPVRIRPTDLPQIHHRLFVCHRKKVCGMNHRLKNRQPQIYHRIFVCDRQKVCGKFCGKSVTGFQPVVDLDTSVFELKSHK